MFNMPSCGSMHELSCRTVPVWIITECCLHVRIKLSPGIYGPVYNIFFICRGNMVPTSERSRQLFSHIHQCRKIVTLL